MKNIHILPTDKPSRVYYNTEIPNNFIYNANNFPLHEDLVEDKFKPQNIYITSDEKIKEGDCMFDVSEMIVYKCIGQGVSGYKIILTTDQDLIKDGIQAIDDEFLEWFVKNPSCEEVEVKQVADLDLYYKNGIGGQKYKITIPKEEPKQETLEEAAKRLCNFSLSERVGFYKCFDWQQERSYSEEEVIWAILTSSNKGFKNSLEVKEWWNNFKNK